MSVVSEIMTPKKVVTINGQRSPSLHKAAELMIKNKVGSVIVVDRDSKPVGIITERDILKKSARSNKPLKEISVSTSMSSPVIGVRAYDSIETAAAVMAKNKIKRLAVLEQDGSLAGMLSITDISYRLARILTDEHERYSKLRAMLELSSL